MAMKCSMCGNENPDGKRFCGDCGRSLLADSQKEVGIISKILAGQPRNPIGWTAEEIKNEARKDGIPDQKAMAIVRRLVDRGEIYTVIFYRRPTEP